MRRVSIFSAFLGFPTYPRSDRKRRSAFAISSSLRSRSFLLLSLASQRSANAAPFVAPRQSLKSMLEDCERGSVCGDVDDESTRVLLTQLVVDNGAWYCPFRGPCNES